MSVSNYLMLNLDTNIVDNVIVWDGNTSKWQPPAGYQMFNDDETEALTWQPNADATDWELKPVMGAGCIGFIWNGSQLVTPDPKPTNPPPNQPISSGTQDL